MWFARLTIELQEIQMPRPDFAAEERLIQQLDRESMDRTERVKALLRDEGRQDLADQLDQKIGYPDLSVETTV